MSKVSIKAQSVDEKTANEVIIAYKNFEESNLKRAMSNSHNLKEIIGSYNKEKRLNKSGVANSSYFTTEDTDKHIASITGGDDGVRDSDIMSEYEKMLKAGKVSNSFTAEDGEIYYIVKGYLDNYNDPRERAYWSFAISKFFDTLKYRLNGKTSSKAFIKAYRTGGTLKICPSIGSPAPFGVKWNRNPLKESAWAVTHTYLIPTLIPEKTMIMLTPKDSVSGSIWNSYIDAMDDVHEDVKKYFYINTDGSCIFTDMRKDTHVETEVIPPDEVTVQSPSEDDTVPFEDAIVVEVVGNKAVPVVSNDTTIEEAMVNHKAMDAECKEAIERDDQKDASKRKNEDKKHVQEPVDTTVSPFKENNVAFESGVPGLSRFTKIVHKNKCYVNYSNSQVYPGLIEAMICTQTNPQPFNKLMIDPCLIYGDSLRVVTVMNNNADIRKESFVSINQPDVVSKLITGTFSKEDRDKHNQDLPRVMSDYRSTYHILDRVDLRGITQGKFKNGMPYQEYRKLLINISNILRDTSVPMCRFRVMDVESGDKFKLICDFNVLAAYPTQIYNEPSHIQAVQNKFWVVFDAEKYKKSNGFMTQLKETDQNLKTA